MAKKRQNKKMKTTISLDFSGFGAKKIETVEVASTVKPNTGPVHSGKITPVEHVLIASAGYVACKNRKCERKAAQDGECLPCHKKSVERANKAAERQKDREERRAQKEFTPEEREEYQTRKLRRIKNYAIKGDVDSEGLLKKDEKTAAYALRANYLGSLDTNRKALIDAFDWKAAVKLGVGKKTDE